MKKLCKKCKHLETFLMDDKFVNKCKASKRVVSNPFGEGVVDAYINPIVKNQWLSCRDWEEDDGTQKAD